MDKTFLIFCTVQGFKMSHGSKTILNETPIGLLISTYKFPNSKSVVILLRQFFLKSEHNYNRIIICEWIHRIKFCCWLCPLSGTESESVAKMPTSANKSWAAYFFHLIWVYQLISSISFRDVTCLCIINHYLSNIVIS